MLKRIFSALLAICMLCAIMPCNAFAAQTYAYSIKASSTSVPIGAEVEVAVALTDYDSKKSGIIGLQLDIGNIDTEVIEVISQTSMIKSSFDKATYQPKRKVIRLFYMDPVNQTEIDKSVSEVLRFKIKIKDTLTQDGSITLPVSLKIGNAANESIKINDSIKINYNVKPTDIVNVDVTWGSMEFLYDDGTWNTETHKWDNRGWKSASESSNVITVSNTGTKDVKIRFAYSQVGSFTQLSGEFTDSENKVINSPVDLKADSKIKTFRFSLSGSVDSRWADKYVTLGKVTLTIN